MGSVFVSINGVGRYFDKERIAEHGVDVSYFSKDLVELNIGGLVVTVRHDAPSEATIDDVSIDGEKAAEWLSRERAWSLSASASIEDSPTDVKGTSVAKDELKEKVKGLLRQSDTQEMLIGDWWTGVAIPSGELAPLGFDVNVYLKDGSDPESPFSIAVYPLMPSNDGDNYVADVSELIFSHTFPAADFGLWLQSSVSSSDSPPLFNADIEDDVAIERPAP